MIGKVIERAHESAHLAHVDVELKGLCELSGEPLGRFLRHSSSLSVLQAGRNNLGCVGITSLSEAVLDGRVTSPAPLPGAASGQKISLLLQDNQIREDGAVSLSRMLTAGNLPITLLDLSGNLIGERGGAALGRALASASCLIADLRLNGCAIGDAVGADLIRAIGGAEGEGAAASIARVGKLSLSSNELGARFAEAARGVSVGAVRELTLRDNCLGAEGCRLVAERFRGHLLDLAGNAIGSGEDAVRAVEDIARNEGIRELSLFNNALGDTGAGAIARSGKSLVVLDLGANKITSHGLEVLCKSLEHGEVLSGLKELDIGANAEKEHQDEWMAVIKRVNRDTVKIAWKTEARGDIKE